MQSNYGQALFVSAFLDIEVVSTLHFQAKMSVGSDGRIERSAGITFLQKTNLFDLS